MIVRRALSLIAFAALLAAAPVRAAAGTDSVAVAVSLGPGSTLWLEGTSTLHDFESRTTATTFAVTRDAATAAPRDASDLATLMRTAAVRGVDVTVPVLTLHSGKDGLDKNLWKALRAAEHPDITFHLERYARPDAPENADTLALRAEGALTVAGQARPVTLEARAYRGSGGVWLEGRQVLRMTEFGIKPPRMMLGTIRVGDAITVHYRLLLVVRNGESSPAATSRP